MIPYVYCWPSLSKFVLHLFTSKRSSVTSSFSSGICLSKDTTASCEKVNLKYPVRGLNWNGSAGAGGGGTGEGPGNSDEEVYQQLVGNDQAAADAAASAESAAAKNRSKVSSTRHSTPLEEVLI